MEYYYTLIIPHYNNPNYLARLLSSVPKRRDLQVIVVDDCSTCLKGSIDKIKNSFSGIEWYDTEKNGGGGKARNIGLRHALGKYVLFADSDDFFLPCFSQILDQYKTEDFDIVYFPAISLDTETYYPAKRNYGNIEKIKKGIEKNDASILRFSFTVPWGKIIKREIITNNNIQFEESNISNDVYFSTLVDYFVKKCAVDKRVLYCITDRIDSVSKDLSPQRALTRLIIDTNRIKFLKDRNIDINIPYEHIISSIMAIRNAENNNLYHEAIIHLAKIGISEREILLGLFKFRLKKKFGIALRRMIPTEVRKRISFFLS